MFFKQGDCFEISGTEQRKVIFADEEKFIAVRIGHTPIGSRLLTSSEVYSNEKKDFEGKYWIKKIETVDCPYCEFKKL